MSVNMAKIRLTARSDKNERFGSEHLVVPKI